MKRILFLTVFVCMSFLSSPKFAQANNLLANANFENGINSWTTFGPNWQPQNQVVREGLISVRNIITTITGFDYYASLSQTFSASPGQTFYATVDAKTNFNVQSNARAGVLVQFLDSSGNVIDSIQDETGGSTDWKFLYVSKTTPTNAAQVKYNLFILAPKNETQSGGIALGGTAFFDLACLSTIPINPPLPQTALKNPSYENGLVDWKTILSPVLSTDNQKATQGTYSLKIDYDLTITPTFDFFTAAYQDLQYVSGPIYAAADIETQINPSSPSALAGLKLEYYDAQGLLRGTDEQTLHGNNP